MNKKKLKELREELMARQVKILDGVVDVDQELARLRSDNPSEGTLYIDPAEVYQMSPLDAKEYRYNGNLLVYVNKLLEKS